MSLCVWSIWQFFASYSGPKGLCRFINSPACVQSLLLNYKKLLVSLALFGQNLRQSNLHVMCQEAHLTWQGAPCLAGLCASSLAQQCRGGNPKIRVRVQGNRNRQSWFIYFPTFCRNKHFVCLFFDLGCSQGSWDGAPGSVVLRHRAETTGHCWPLARPDLDLQDPLSVNLTVYKQSHWEKQNKQAPLELKTSFSAWISLVNF